LAPKKADTTGEVYKAPVLTGGANKPVEVAQPLPATVSTVAVKELEKDTLKATITPKSSETGVKTELKIRGKHIIQPGESISVIASKYKIKRALLLQANNISGDKIKAGDELLIPEAP
jgi:LysM repeat protein